MRTSLSALHLSRPREATTMTRLSTGSFVGNAFTSVEKLIQTQGVIASGVFSFFNQNNAVYPCIIVDSPEADTFWKSFGATSHGKKVEFTVQCYADNAKQADELADDVERIINGNRQALANSGLSLPEVNFTNMDHPIINGKQRHAKEVLIQFSYIGARV